MTRRDQTAFIVVALIILAAFGFWMFQQSQDANAIARDDRSACWSDSCQRAITDRQTGATIPGATDDEAATLLEDMNATAPPDAER